MKIFVTGATGFVGSHFLKTALAAKHEVVALRRSFESKPRLACEDKESYTRLTWVTKVMGDVHPEDVAGCETLVHLAAFGVTPQPASWEHCYRVNVLESLALAENARLAGVKRLVATGTYAEYGRAGLRFDLIPPDAPLEPTDPYAASKASGGIALAAFCREQKLELIYYRLFSAFGEGQYEQNFWPLLRRAAQAGEDFPMTEGDQIRDFIPVESAAEILLEACFRKDVKPGEPLIANLASGEPTSLREFAEKWWARFGAKGRLRIGAIPSRPNEVKRYVPLVEKR